MNFIKLIKNILRFSTSLIFFFAFSSAFAVKFSNLFFLGDSLSDIGNAFDHDQYRQPGGINWTQFLAGKFGQSISSSNNGGTNYAYAGAKSDDNISPEGIRGALVQTNDLLAAHPHLDSKALYSLWIGANDLKSVLEPDPQPLPVIFATIDACSNNIATILQKLHNAGAQYIILGNMPDLGKTADGFSKDPLSRAIANLLSQRMNTEIRNKVNSLGFDVIQVDDYGLVNKVINHPEEFGFRPMIASSDPKVNMCKYSGDPSCAGYLFWDDIHPTQQAYSMIADYDYSILVAPDYYAYLAETPFGIVQNQHNTIKKEILEQNTLGAMSKPYFFIDGNYVQNRSSVYDDDRVKNKITSGGGTLGVLYPVTQQILVGGAFGYDHDFTKLSGDVYEYNTNASNLSIFSDYHQHDFYITGTINAGYIHDSNIKRAILVGPAELIATGDTSGWNFGGAVDGGYFINIPNTLWRTGPIADIAYQRIYINGYTEDGNADEQFAELTFEDQHNDSFDTALGWEINFKQPVNGNTFSGNIFATVNKEWLDGDRDISFHVVSIPGSHASLPVGTPADFYLNTGVSLGYTFSKVYTVSIGYNGLFGPDHIKQKSFNLGLSISM